METSSDQVYIKKTDHSTNYILKGIVTFWGTRALFYAVQFVRALLSNSLGQVPRSLQRFSTKIVNRPVQLSFTPQFMTVNAVTININDKYLNHGVNSSE
jgi:hypothetical protein